MTNSTVNITNCTFANNYAGWVGGAIVSDKNNTKIKNTIFYQNTAGNGGNNWRIQQHTSDNLVDLGNNIQFPAKFTNNFNDFNVSTSVTIIDPKLLPIADNGGFSPTMALEDGSPAINKGSSCTPTDQRGAPRVGICDIGAYEYNSTLTTVKAIGKVSSLLLYPNPSINNQLKISMIESLINNTVNLKVYNALGNLVLTEDNVNMEGEYSLSLVSLAPGIYTLHLENGEQTYTNNFVK